MIKTGQKVVLYGAGFRGARNHEILANENVRVEAFCDRDAEQIPSYRGCEVLSPHEAMTLYKQLAFIVCIDTVEARREVLDTLREAGIDAYPDIESFYQGVCDINAELITVGEGCTYEVYGGFGCDPLVFSFGIGWDYSFERELIERFHATVYAFDPTPEVEHNLRNYPAPDGFVFTPVGLSDADTVKEFHRSTLGYDYSEFYTSWTSKNTMKMQFHRLSTLMERFDIGHIDILKMDIEGSEFLAIPDILDSGIRPDQICLETHARIFSNSVERMRELKKNLNDAGYLLISNGIHEQTYILDSFLRQRDSDGGHLK